MDKEKELQQIRVEQDKAQEVLAEIIEKRNELMRRLWDNGKGWTLDRIGKVYGLTRERVRQAISKL